MHKEIRLSQFDSFFLFFFNNFWPFDIKSPVNKNICCCFPYTWSKKGALMRMYDMGKEKIDGGVDILKIMKSHNKLMYLIKKTSMDKDFD